MKKRLIYQFLFTFAVTMLAGSVFYYAICAGLKKSSRDAAGKLNYIFSDTTYYNTIFVGPSTVHLGADPRVFDSLTNHRTNSFNTAMDGFTLLEMDLTLHKYFKSHGVPQNVYYNIAGNSLVTDSSLWFFSQYFPFISDPDFAPLIKREPKLMLGKYCPPLAATYFNDPLRSIGLIGLLSHKSKPDDIIALRGYAPSKKEIGAKDPVSDLEFRQHDDGWNILNQSIAFCKQNKVNLVILLTPMHNVKLTPSSMAVIDHIKSVALKNHVKVIDLLTDARFNPGTLFADRRHLNSNGAHLLSSILAADYLAGN